MSYNVHALIHLAQDVRLHGTLDSSSAYKYEFFRPIKKASPKTFMST